jgi:hypothetical protein
MLLYRVVNSVWRKENFENMKRIFLEPGEEFLCPHCKSIVVSKVTKTIYFSDTIGSLGNKCRLNTNTVGSRTRIEEAASKCIFCHGNVYEDIIRSIQYKLPDELFEI